MAVESTMLPLGTAAPDAVLHTTAGAAFALHDVPADRGLLVAFVCNHCPYVQHIASPLGALATRWQDAGVAVVAVMSNDADAYPDDAPEHMDAFAGAHGWSFPYLVDADQSVAAAFHAACTPDLFLFDGARRLAYRGRLDSSRPGSGVPVTGDDLQAAIDAVLDGRAAPEPQHPSIGCSIKWRPGAAPTWAT